jgi:hypothetical protein
MIYTICQLKKYETKQSKILGLEIEIPSKSTLRKWWLVLDTVAVKASEIPTYAIIQCIHNSFVFETLLSEVLVRISS